MVRENSKNGYWVERKKYNCCELVGSQICWAHDIGSALDRQTVLASTSYFIQKTASITFHLI